MAEIGGLSFNARSLSYRWLAAACLGGLAALSEPALAQNDPPQSDDHGIGEIVVTARYVAENIQETPIAITAKTGEQLDSANVTNIGTLGAVIPNLSTVPGDSSSAGTPRIFLRGVQQGESSSLAVPPAVAIYNDDIYHSTTAGSELDFTDVVRVEVNRGPQSTLSGNASIAGSIKLFTQDPKGDGSGFASLSYGSRNHMEVAGAVDLGLSPTLAIRVLGHFDRQTGYGNRLDFTCMMDKLGTRELAGSIPYFEPDSAQKNCIIGHTGGGTTAVGQIKLKWTPIEDVSLLLTARHRREELEPTAEVSLGYRTACFDTPGCPASAGAQAYYRATYNTFGVILGPQFVTPERNGGIYDTYATYCRPALDKSGGGFPAGYPDGYCYPAQTFADHTLLSAKLEAALTESVNMTAIGGYTKYSNDFAPNSDQSPLGNLDSHFNNIDEMWSGELRFDGKLLQDKLQWVVGGFTIKTDGYQNNLISSNNVFQLSSVHGINKSTSGFAHLDFNITDSWRISGGGRYTHTDIGITIDNPRAVSVLDPIHSIQNRWDWLISTDYKISDDVLLYASVATGSRPPGLTTIVQTSRQLSPTSDEDLISYETGIKADLLDRRLRTNLTAFYIDYKKLSTSVRGIECRNEPGATATWFNVDITDPQANVVCGQFAGTPDPISYNINIGKPATIKGFEWEISAIPVDGLRIDWTGGYNKFTSGEKTPGAPGYLAPGNHIQPEWSMHANAGYDIETSIGTFTPRLDWSWQSQQDFDATPQTGLPDPVYIIHPYSLWNAQIAYKSPDRDWSAVLQVTNLADKWYHYQVLVGSVNTYTRIAAPREWKLTVRKEF